jgi:hypothetical protein
VAPHPPARPEADLRVHLQKADPSAARRRQVRPGPGRAAAHRCAADLVRRAERPVPAARRADRWRGHRPCADPRSGGHPYEDHLCGRYGPGVRRADLVARSPTAAHRSGRTSPSSDEPPSGERAAVVAPRAAAAVAAAAVAVAAVAVAAAGQAGSGADPSESPAAVRVVAMPVVPETPVVAANRGDEPDASRVPYRGQRLGQRSKGRPESGRRRRDATCCRWARHRPDRARPGHAHPGQRRHAGRRASPAPLRSGRLRAYCPGPSDASCRTCRRRRAPLLLPALFGIATGAARAGLRAGVS